MLALYFRVALRARARTRFFFQLSGYSFYSFLSSFLSFIFLLFTYSLTHILILFPLLNPLAQPISLPHRSTPRHCKTHAAKPGLTACLSMFVDCCTHDVKEERKCAINYSRHFFASFPYNFRLYFHHALGPGPASAAPPDNLPLMSIFSLLAEGAIKSCLRGRDLDSFLVVNPTQSQAHAKLPLS